MVNKKGVGQPYIRASHFVNTKIPLPSLENQEKIVEELSKIENRIKSIETSIKQLKEEDTFKKYSRKSELKNYSKMQKLRNWVKCVIKLKVVRQLKNVIELVEIFHITERTGIHKGQYE